MRELSAELQIMRSSDNTFVIEVRDLLSYQFVCTLRLTDAEFGRAVGGGSVSVPMCYFGGDKIGMRYEFKRELVRCPASYCEDFAGAIAEEAKQFEIDGWKHRAERRYNDHYHRPNDMYEIGFDRWVPVEDEEQGA